MLLGTLEALRRYPIKSLRGEALDAATIERDGIPGDRATALFAAGGSRAGKTYRGKEHDSLHLFEDAGGAIAAAEQRGVRVELRRADHFFDDAPISIVIDVWLSGLNAHVGYGVEWERFRPNFYVRAATDDAPAETALIGECLMLGAAQLRVRGPIERCVAITYHPDGEPSDPRILRYLAKTRSALLGIYCDVERPGIVRAGDVLKRGAAP